VLLGLGADGHTASLFPGSPDADAARLAAPATGPDGARVTLTARALSAGRLVVFLVTGAEKRDAVRRALDDAADPSRNPTRRLLRGSGRVLWLLDRAAAGDYAGAGPAKERRSPP
jgi:6-phosphogluconolactonase